jgi:hypothetical protein
MVPVECHFVLTVPTANFMMMKAMHESHNKIENIQIVDTQTGHCLLPCQK